MKIQVINKSKHPLPKHETEHAAAVDLRANIDEPVVLQPLDRAVVPTGIFAAIPIGYEAQIRPRSGLAIKHGITMINAPGTIDADYRGEYCVLMVNLGKEAFTIEDGDRIAQMIISKHETIEWNEVEVLDETERQDKRFGSTGRS